MARAKMRKVTLLGLFFCVPLGYTLLARLLHGDADQLAVNADEELRFCKPLEPVGCLLIGQRCEILAVLRRAADEERACNHIIDLPFFIPQGAVQRQAQQLALVIADQGCVSSSWFVYDTILPLRLSFLACVTSVTGTQQSAQYPSGYG